MAYQFDRLGLNVSRVNAFATDFAFNFQDQIVLQIASDFGHGQDHFGLEQGFRVNGGVRHGVLLLLLCC